MKATWKKLHSGLPDWLLIVVTVLVAVLFLFAIAAGVISFLYQGRVLPNVSVAGAYVGGMDYRTAEAALERKISVLEKGVPVRYEKDEFIVASEVASLDPDLNSPLVVFDQPATLARIARIGRSGNFAANALEQLRVIMNGRQVPLAVSTDHERVVAELENHFARFEEQAGDARLSIDSRGAASVIAEKDGRTFDYAAAADEVAENLAAGTLMPVVLELRDVTPEIRRNEVGNIQPDVDRLLATPAAELKYESKAWKLDRKVMIAALGLTKTNGRIGVALDKQLIKKYLESEVVPEIASEPVEAKLTIENGRVSVWQAGKAGLEVDLDKTAEAIAAWPEQNSPEIQVVVIKKETISSDQSAEDLGIKEIIGTGTSKFSGSPANRRHNIKTGAMALHGLLIKPGEEFSLLKALGNIDASNGYRTELVIKGNKTIPEYGGGLCQIGTTVFRATFNTGLPVTQRRNHSYRVSYYEPAGTDATIYDPAPDYRFVNDTGHYILIQARLSDNELSFDFWGTKDGRKVEVSKPTIYNIVSPKATKIIETPDLPEGQKKCTESAHAGADAFFDTKVTYASGEIKEKRFTSHYVPWQAVCLVGAKKALPADPSSPTPLPATSTATPSN